MYHINILSVDWDYFFPNQEWFDWGHSEKSIFMETAWQWRAGNRNLLTSARAVDVFRTDPERLNKFWEHIYYGSRDFPNILVVAESHKDIVDMFASYSKPFHVYNFDAHHDLGYTHNDHVDCGNWASKYIEDGRIEKYVLIYPKWRKVEPEAGVRDLKKRFGGKVFIKYEKEFLLMPTLFHAVFICRSSAWTPTWCDNEWTKFVSFWKVSKYLWKDRVTCPFVEKERKPNLKQAIESANKWEKEIAKLNNEEVISDGFGL